MPSFVTSFPLTTPLPRSTPRCQLTPQTELLNLLSQSPSRTANSPQLLSLIDKLETTCPPPSPTTFLGTWRTLRTTLPSTASPIQRFILSNPSFAPSVEQEIVGTSLPDRIFNRVDLLAILGATLTVEAEVEKIEASRLYIRFARAYFDILQFPNWLGGSQLQSKLRIPYPVPFKALGDIARGWLETTYCSNSIRISRGTKGTVFILERVNDG